MRKLKKFNMFVFLSTFAKGLIEVFIPIILLEKGFSFQSFLFYFIIKFAFASVFTVFAIKLGKKIKFKNVLIISAFLFVISILFLENMQDTILSISVLAVLFAAHMATYWSSRHYYAMEILPKRNIADEVGNIVIFGSLAIIPSSYIGAVLIDSYGMLGILLVVMVFSLVSIYPIFGINERKIKKKAVSIKQVYNSYPKRSFVFAIFNQFRVIGYHLFPIFLFTYIQNNFRYIGLFNMVVGITSMVFVYFFSRRMDKKKSDYLFISGLLVGLTWILKLNILVPIFILIIGLLEGFVLKAYDTANTRNLYALGKHYDTTSYLAFYEFFQNTLRCLIVLCFYLLGVNLGIILFICAIAVMIAGFVGFDDGPGGY